MIHRETDLDDLELGPLLRRLRGTKSLRDVHVLTGISTSYLSQVERGDRQPGPKLLQRLAAIYDVEVHYLLRRAGYLDEASALALEDDTLDVERCYQFVLADPRFRFGARPRGPLDLDAKRFIVKMYEEFTGMRLLQ